MFDTVLEVLVLMEPDGTVDELNRKEAPWRAANARVIQNTHKVQGMLVHSSRAFADSRIAVAPQIRKDQAVARRH